MNYSVPAVVCIRHLELRSEQDISVALLLQHFMVFMVCKKDIYVAGVVQGHPAEVELVAFQLRSFI